MKNNGPCTAFRQEDIERVETKWNIGCAITLLGKIYISRGNMYTTPVKSSLRQVAPYLDLPDSALRLAYFKVSTDTAGIVCSCER